MKLNVTAEDALQALWVVVMGVMVKLVVDSVVETRQSLDNVRLYVENVEREFITFMDSQKKSSDASVPNL